MEDLVANYRAATVVPGGATVAVAAQAAVASVPVVQAVVAPAAADWVVARVVGAARRSWVAFGRARVCGAVPAAGTERCRLPGR